MNTSVLWTFQVFGPNNKRFVFQNPGKIMSAIKVKDICPTKHDIMSIILVTNVKFNTNCNAYRTMIIIYVSYYYNSIVIYLKNHKYLK